MQLIVKWINIHLPPIIELEFKNSIMLQSIKQGLLVCMLLLCLVGDLSSKPSFDNGSSPVSQSEENVDVRNALILEFHLNIDCITIHDVHNFTERLLVDEKEEDEKHHKSVN